MAGKIAGPKWIMFGRESWGTAGILSLTSAPYLGRMASLYLRASMVMACLKRLSLRLGLLVQNGIGFEDTGIPRLFETTKRLESARNGPFGGDILGVKR